jgi:hypothetical protein
LDLSECKRIVERHILPLKDAFGLRYWTITVTYRPRRKSKGKCNGDASYEQATINLDPDRFEDGDEDDVLSVLRHELFHVVISPINLVRHLALLGIEGREYDRMLVTLNYAGEQTIRNLERLWACGEEYWRSVMAREAKMPLKKGSSKKTKEHNFHELKKAHPEMPNKQRVAIVLSTARKSKPKRKKKSS